MLLIFYIDYKYIVKSVPESLIATNSWTLHTNEHSTLLLVRLSNFIKISRWTIFCANTFLLLPPNTACYYNIVLYHGRWHNNNNNYQIDIIEEIQVTSDRVFEMEGGKYFPFSPSLMPQQDLRIWNMLICRFDNDADKNIEIYKTNI